MKSRGQKIEELCGEAAGAYSKKLIRNSFRVEKRLSDEEVEESVVDVGDASGGLKADHFSVICSKTYDIIAVCNFYSK